MALFLNEKPADIDTVKKVVLCISGFICVLIWYLINLAGKNLQAGLSKDIAALIEKNEHLKNKLTYSFRAKKLKIISLNQWFILSFNLAWGYILLTSLSVFSQ